MQPALPKTRGSLIPIIVVSALSITALGLWVMQRAASNLPQVYPYKYANLLHNRAKTRTQAYQDEIAFYQTRIQGNPNSGLDLQELSKTYMKKARVTGQGTWYLLAEQAAERSLAVLPFYNSAATVVEAEVAAARHDFSGALGLLQQVLNGEPHNQTAVSLRANIYLAMGRLSEAERDAQTLVTAAPNLINLTSRALVYEAQGRLEAAETDFKNALSLEEPDDPFGSARTRSMLARFYARHGQLELAQSLFQEALNIAPHYPQAVQLLADLDSRQGNYRQAAKLYNALLGSHAAIGNETQGSGTVYDHAAMRGLARIERMSGNPDEQSYWERTEKILRREVQTGAFGHRRELARMLLERGRGSDVKEALEHSQIEVRSRRDWETLEVLAWAQLRNNQAQAAQKTIQETLNIGVQDAEVFYLAGQIEQALGHSSKAQQYFQQASKTDPRFDAKTRKLVGIEVGR